jgi:hypothetical protein
MRSVGTSVASAVMVSLLTSSTEDFGGFAIPSQSAFQICFIVGAAAAFVGVAITALVPAAGRAPSTTEVSVPEPSATESSEDAELSAR